MKKILIGLLFAVSLLGVTKTGYCVEENPVLVIVDMQPYFAKKNGYFKRDGNKEKYKNVIEEQKKVIAEARGNNIPIIFVEFKLPRFHTLRRKKTSKTLRDAVEGYEYFTLVQKTTNNIFHNLNEFKQDFLRAVDHYDGQSLIIMGANGSACIYQSIHGALNENYSVVAYSKGIADFNSPFFIYPFADFGKLDEVARDKETNFYIYKEFDQLSGFMESDNH